MVIVEIILVTDDLLPVQVNNNSDEAEGLDWIPFRIIRTKGKVTSWNDEKGFGFVEPCSGGKSVFLHIKALSRRGRSPEIGQFVTCTLSTDRQGRPCATRATLPGDRLSQKTKSQSSPLAVAVATIFFIAVAASVLASKIPPLILAHYSGASLLAFIVYAIDKAAAKEGGWRTQESTLHLLALIGGWPGALVAQQKLRHKSKKNLFDSLSGLQFV